MSRPPGRHFLCNSNSRVEYGVVATKNETSADLMYACLNSLCVLRFIAASTKSREARREVPLAVYLLTLARSLSPPLAVFGFGIQ